MVCVTLSAGRHSGVKDAGALEYNLLGASGLTEDAILLFAAYMNTVNKQANKHTQ